MHCVAFKSVPMNEIPKRYAVPILLGLCIHRLFSYLFEL